MSSKTTENFWRVWNEWDRAAPPPIVFKLYYNDAGDPLLYTTDTISGNYIEVDAITCQRANMKVRVVNGQIVELATTIFKKLVPSDHGTACDPTDVSIVTSSTKPHINWSFK